jgi:glycosyltransferase involved in cell wall biosynthesis
MKPTILISSASGETKFFGGLGTHENRLRGFLQSAADVSIVRLGSSATLVGRLTVALQIFRLFAAVRSSRWSYLVLNSPMFPTSCIKLAMILTVIPAQMRGRTVIFFHGGRLDSAWTKLLGRISATLFRSGVRCFFLSAVQEAQFRAAMGPNVETFRYRNYSDRERSEPHEFDSEQTRFLFVGRLVEGKGICEALEAFDLLCKERPNLSIRLAVCGDGSLRDSLESKYSNLVRTGKLSFLGHLVGTHLRDVYKTSDVLVFPSRSEGFPYVLIEAFEHHLCILATPEGALAEHVIDGRNGFLIHRPVITPLTRKMELLASDRNLLRRLSANAGAHFDHHFRRSLGANFYKHLFKL